MLPTESKQFRNVIVGMGRMYGQELDQLVLDAYWLALKDWALEDFEDAARHLMQTAKFMPRPADFRELQKAGRPTAGEAWLAIRAMARSSLTSEPDDPVAARALRAIGGLRAVGLCDYSRIEFMERRFAEHFETMQEAEDIREAVPQIAGASYSRLTGPQSIQNLLGRMAEDDFEKTP